MLGGGREESVLVNWRWFVHGFAATTLAAFAIGCGQNSAPVSADQDTPTAEREFATGPCVTPEDTDRMADQLLQLINLERAGVGIAPVATHAKLGQIADDYACRMITEGFFGHRDPITGHGPGERAVGKRYAFFSVGENLAGGQETAAEVMKGWMESPSHQRLVMDPKWKDVGITVRTGGEYGIYWVLEFGDPAGS